MQPFLAVVLSLSVFSSTLIAQTGAPPDPKSFERYFTTAQIALSLNGVWQSARTDKNGKPLILHILISSDKGRITLCGTSDDKTCAPDLISTAVITGDPPVLQIAPGRNTGGETVTAAIPDPDHLKAANWLYVRSAPGAYDVPCDAKNSSHVTGEFAAVRGRDAIGRHNDYQTGYCWFAISGDLGDARSQAITAYLIHEGLGVRKSMPVAYAWAKESAEAGDAFGQEILGGMYEKNEVPNPDPAQARIWIAKKYEQLNRQKQEQAQAQQKTQPGAQSPQTTNPYAVMGAILLGMVLLGGMGMGSSSSGSSDDDFQSESARIQRDVDNRQERNRQENNSGCNNGDAAACNRAGR
jgi:TPR repeat protein